MNQKPEGSYDLHLRFTHRDPKDDHVQYSSEEEALILNTHSAIANLLRNSIRRIVQAQKNMGFCDVLIVEGEHDDATGGVHEVRVPRASLEHLIDELELVVIDRPAITTEPIFRFIEVLRALTSARVLEAHKMRLATKIRAKADRKGGHNA